ncbi:MAG: VanW family protein [Clostridium sp.]|nr:VanW family protein [Clostridium sp.]
MRKIMRNTPKFIAALLLMVSCCLSAFTPVHAATQKPIDYSSVFDAEYYYNNYPDLHQSVQNTPSSLLQHFITVGMKEGRNGNASFNVKAYMANNLDLLPVYGVKDLSSYYLHYINIGKAEGRVAVYKNGAQPPEGVLSSYSTTYNVKEERAVNVELAAANIDGLVIEPGQKFSFSNSIGSRTLANGYVVAPSFASGRVVSSVGGGICQVSSTIHVAMLLAGIAPTQRYPHSLPVDYVPTGLDSAIVEGYKDLTFTNNFDFALVINTSVENGTLTVTFSQQAPASKDAKKYN